MFFLKNNDSDELLSISLVSYYLVVLIMINVTYFQSGKYMDQNSPSLYETLTGNFTGDLPLDVVSEEEQVILSVLDNIQRILNSRTETNSHLPDFGFPDMTKILQGMPGTANQLIDTLSATLLKYEPRLKSLNVVLLPQSTPGHLEYGIDAELKEFGLVHFGTAFIQQVCRCLSLTRSVFYAQSHRPMFKPDILMLHVIVKHVHAEIDATYGSRRMCIELREQSFNIGRYLPWRKALSSSGTRQITQRCSV